MTKLCDNPRPQYGGKPCEGEDTKTRSCKEQPCPSEIFTVFFLSEITTLELNIWSSTL